MIDVHVHAGQFHLLREDIQALLTRRPFESGVDVAQVFSRAELLERYLRGYGVERAVMLAECGPGTNFSIDSAMIAEMARGSSFFVPFGSINPHHHDVPAELEKSLQLGVRGFKFYPADHGFNPYLPDMMAVYARCEAEHMPVMFHTGTTAQKDASQEYIRPEEFEEIIKTFPRLTIILAHAGKPHWYQSARRIALTYENVYLDTALVEPASLVQEYGDLRDLRKKILFASDWPVVGSYAALVAKLEQARIAPDVADDILGDNARRILASIPNA